MKFTGIKPVRPIVQVTMPDADGDPIAAWLTVGTEMDSCFCCDEPLWGMPAIEFDDDATGLMAMECFMESVQIGGARVATDTMRVDR